MRKIGMIADDLTGANDSGVQLVKKGLRSTVVFDLHPQAAEEISSDAIIVDTDSRAANSKESYEAVSQASIFLKKNGFTHIYKKIDSTLRGNIGVEIEAVTDVFQPEFCVIAPAFPRIGRTTKSGIHYLNGLPVSETEIAKDPKTPVNESSLCRLLESQVNQKVGLVDTAGLGDDLESWKTELSKWQEKGINWLVFDVEIDGDLERIASNISRITTNVVWVGSAGLAEFLPEKLGLTTSIPKESKTPQNSNVLVVSGSLSSVTKEQVSRLVEMDTIKGIEVDPLSVFEDGKWEDRKRTYIERLEETYKQGFDAVLYVDSSFENRNNTAEAGKKLGLSPSEVSNRIASGLGEITSEFIKNHSYVSGLVLTGGDTAKDVCRQIRTSGLELLEEVEPGIPLGKLVGDYELFAITKAGAFGNKDSLANAVQKLKGGTYE